MGGLFQVLKKWMSILSDELAILLLKWDATRLVKFALSKLENAMFILQNSELVEKLDKYHLSDIAIFHPDEGNTFLNQIYKKKLIN